MDTAILHLNYEQYYLLLKLIALIKVLQNKTKILCYYWMYILEVQNGPALVNCWICYRAGLYAEICKWGEGRTWDILKGGGGVAASSFMRSTGRHGLTVSTLNLC